MRAQTRAICEHLSDYEEPKPGVESLLEEAERWLKTAVGDAREDCAAPFAHDFEPDRTGWNVVVTFEHFDGPHFDLKVHVDRNGDLDTFVDEAITVAAIRKALATAVVPVEVPAHQQADAEAIARRHGSSIERVDGGLVLSAPVANSKALRHDLHEQGWTTAEAA